MTDTEALLRRALPELEAMQRFLNVNGRRAPEFSELVATIAIHLHYLNVQRASTLDDEGTPI